MLSRIGACCLLLVLAGGHSINGAGTFTFLHKHLNWPAPEEVPASVAPPDRR